MYKLLLGETDNHNNLVTSITLFTCADQQRLTGLVK